MSARMVTERKEQLCVRKAVLREQNALPLNIQTTINSTAKDAIDNGGAGRAAKSANPLLVTNYPHTRRFTRTMRFLYIQKSV